MFDLGNPQYQYLIVLPVLVWVAYMVYKSWRKKKQVEFADSDLFKQINPNQSKRKPVIKQILRFLGLTFLVIALVNPKIGTRIETVTRKGVDVVFAIDVSKSMLAEDISPSRILKAKQILSKAIDELVNDRIGIIVYAGKAYAQLPLTTDYTAAKMFLRTIDTDMVPTQGTDIGNAVEMALSYFESGKEQNRVLFILSDGESHEEGALEASELASENGIVIHAIALGTLEGGPIPIKRNGVIKGYKKDNQDKVVVTKMDPEMLQQLAVSTEGSFMDGTNTKETIEFIKTSLAKMEQVESETEMYTDYEDQFQWFLALALFFFILDFIVPNRKTLWLRKIKLFG
ncbi:MAG: VWA domain-containing protein [Flavobacteriales bacterium]|nr:VWA domain-containing protein [Flavobacteriales bacterium]